MSPGQIQEIVGPYLSEQFSVVQKGKSLQNIQDEIWSESEQGRKEFLLSELAAQVFRQRASADARMLGAIDEFSFTFYRYFEQHEQEVSPRCASRIHRFLSDFFEWREEDLDCPPKYRTPPPLPSNARDPHFVGMEDFSVSVTNLKEEMKFLDYPFWGERQIRDRILDMESTNPSLFRATERDIKSLSDVSFPEQDFVLAPLPQSLEEASRYFEHCLERGVTLFVSAHELTDAPNRCADFWYPEKVREMQLAHWRLEATGGHVYAEGKGRDGASKPQIVESEIVAISKENPSERRVLTHLHFEGWPDHGLSPDRRLLHILLGHMKQLSPNPRNPIAINCKSGVGRTGTIAICYYLRRKIQAMLHQGVPLSDIHVNIPDTICQFRRQRKGTLGSYINPVHIGDLYRATLDYVSQDPSC